METVLVILFAHWAGDYALQTNAMAVNKSRGIQWLTIHVSVYTAVLLAFSLFLFPLQLAVLFALSNGALHWVTDFVTSRLAARYKDNPRIYHPIIGFDQFTHSATLIATLFYWQAY